MPKITNIRPAGPDHQVVTVTDGRKGYRRQPCPGCPWLKSNAGSFPPEAFEHSANTAYDMADNIFGCHESGINATHACAGFLLRGAEHNMAVRMGRATGEFSDDVTDGGAELHENYRAMAVANGVPPDSPALAKCRP